MGSGKRRSSKRTSLREGAADQDAPLRTAGLVAAGALFAVLVAPVVLLLPLLWLGSTALAAALRPKRRAPRRAGIVITGAGRGLGKEAAVALADAGHVVLAGVRRLEAGEKLAEEYSGPGRIVPLVVDVADEDSVRESVDAALEICADEDVELFGLLNNAGIGSCDLAGMADLDVWRKTMDVNVLGTLAMTKHYLPHLIAARGRLANVSSVFGHYAVPGFGSYAASKHALEAAMREMRYSLAGKDVALVSINPGFVSSDLVSDAKADIIDFRERHEEERSGTFPMFWSPAFLKLTMAIIGHAQPAGKDWRRDVVHAFTSERPQRKYTPSHVLFAPAGLTIGLFKYVPEWLMDHVAEAAMAKLPSIAV